MDDWKPRLVVELEPEVYIKLRTKLGHGEKARLFRALAIQCARLLDTIHGSLLIAMIESGHLAVGKSTIETMAKEVIDATDAQTH